MVLEEIQKRFERNMNHNYMILYECDFFEMGSEKTQDYQKRMLLDNKIHGLLPTTYRMVNGEHRYYYEINSLQSMDKLYEKQEFSFIQIKALLSGCISMFGKLEEYLLDAKQVVLHHDYIYLHPESMEPYFVYYPNYDADVRKSFTALVDYLLTKIDHKDEKAVMLGYQVYRYTRNQNYVISEIGNMIQQIEDNRNASCYEDTVFDAKSMEDHAIKDDVVKDYGTKNYDEKDYQIEDYAMEDYEENIGKHTDKGNLFGGVICILIALCGGFVLLGTKTLFAVSLSSTEEMYICGAIAMALTAAAIFFFCYRKKRQEDEELQQERIAEEQLPNHIKVEEEYADIMAFHVKECMAETTYLQKQESLENQKQKETEHVLKGVVDGKELVMPLVHFPVVIGKLADFADCVINDSTVSRIHARLEQRNGSVYLSDLNSTNGTVRNGTMLGMHEEVALESGDELCFGRAKLVFY